MHLDDETLQRYYDGELSPVEERAVRTQVESDPSAQARIAQLARLSELFQLAAEDMGKGVDSAALFAGIETDIDKQRELGFGERLRVVAGEWMEHKRAVIVPFVATTAIAAAALITYLVPGNSNQVALVPSAPTAPATPEPAASEPAKVVHGTRIENVDFGKSTGTVFEIESQGVSTAVVWITDDEEGAP